MAQSEFGKSVNEKDQIVGHASQDQSATDIGKAATRL